MELLGDTGLRYPADASEREPGLEPRSKEQSWKGFAGTGIRQTGPQEG